MRSILVAAIAVVALAGCGGQELTADEQATVATARMHFANVVLDGSEYAETQESVSGLVALYRAKPDAKYEGLTMREVVEDAATTLAGYQGKLSNALSDAVVR